MNDIKKPKTEIIADFLKKNLTNIFLILLCVVYILRGVITMDSEGRTLSDIIIDGLLAFFVAVSIKILMRQKGLTAGYNCSKFVATANAYGDSLEKNVTEYTIECEKYCKYKNKVRLELEQRKYLLRHGLDYHKFLNNEYDEEFKKITNKKERKHKLNILKHCRHIKIYEYSTVMITNAYDNNTSEDKLLSQSAKKYKAKTLTSNFFIGLLCMFLFGYYSVKGGEFDVYSIIWCSIQIALYLVLGAIEQMNAYEFVSETLRGKIKRVISIIDDFTNVRTKQPNLLEEEVNQNEQKEIE